MGLTHSTANGSSSAPSRDTELQTISVRDHVALGNQRFSAGNFAGAVEEATLAINVNRNHIGALTLRANAQFSLGNHQAAIDDCDTVLRINSKNTAALLLRGKSRRLSQNLSGALKDINAALKNEPRNVEALVNRGILTRVPGKFDQSLNAFNQALELSPDHLDALTGRGVTHYCLKRYSDALVDLNAALARSPDYIYALQYRADNYWLSGNYQAAIKDISRILELKPTHGWAMPSLIRVKQALEKRFTDWSLGKKTSNYHPTLADAEIVLSINPNSALALRYSGIKKFGTNDYPLCIEQLTKALSLWTWEKNFEIYQTLGRAQFALGQFKDALENLKQALSLKPEDAVTLDQIKQAEQAILKIKRAEIRKKYQENKLNEVLEELATFPSSETNRTFTLVYRASVNLVMQNYVAALLDIHKLLNKKPSHKWAREQQPVVMNKLTALATSKTASGRYEEAIALWDAVLQVDPTNLNFLLNRGSVRLKLDNPRAAIGDFTQVITLASESTVALQALLKRARARRDINDYLGVVTDFLRLLAADQDSMNSSDFYYLGDAERSLEDYNNALIHLQIALEKNPENGYALRSRGATKRAMGHYDEAYSDLQQALEKEPNNAFALAHRGEILRIYGHVDDALNDLNTSLQIMPNDSVTLRFRGATKLDLNDYAGALVDLQASWQKKSGVAETLRLRGAAYQGLKNHQAALDDFEQALRLDPESPQQGEISRRIEVAKQALQRIDTAVAHHIERHQGYIATKSAAEIQDTLMHCERLFAINLPEFLFTERLIHSILVSEDRYCHLSQPYKNLGLPDAPAASTNPYALIEIPLSHYGLNVKSHTVMDFARDMSRDVFVNGKQVLSNASSSASQLSEKQFLHAFVNFLGTEFFDQPFILEQGDVENTPLPPMVEFILRHCGTSSLGLGEIMQTHTLSVKLNSNVTLMLTDKSGHTQSFTQDPENPDALIYTVTALYTKMLNTREAQGDEKSIIRLSKPLSETVSYRLALVEGRIEVALLKHVFNLFEGCEAGLHYLPALQQRGASRLNRIQFFSDIFDTFSEKNIHSDDRHLMCQGIHDSEPAAAPQTYRFTTEASKALTTRLFKLNNTPLKTEIDSGTILESQVIGRDLYLRPEQALSIPAKPKYKGAYFLMENISPKKLYYCTLNGQFEPIDFDLSHLISFVSKQRKAASTPLKKIRLSTEEIQELIPATESPTQRVTHAGRHRVLKMTLGGKFEAYLKLLSFPTVLAVPHPNDPGLFHPLKEIMNSLFCETFCSGLAPHVQFWKITDEAHAVNREYTVLLSEGMPGTPEWLTLPHPNISPYHFSMTTLLHLILHTTSTDPGNILLDQNGKLFSINHGDTGDSRKPFMNVLFCLPEASQPLHVDAVEYLLNLDIPTFMSHWLEALTSHLNQYGDWIATYTLFEPTQMLGLMSRMAAIQQALKENAELTPLALLKILRPEEESRCYALLTSESSLSILERFRRVAEQLTARDSQIDPPADTLIWKESILWAKFESKIQTIGFTDAHLSELCDFSTKDHLWVPDQEKIRLFAHHSTDFRSLLLENFPFDQLPPAGQQKLLALLLNPESTDTVSVDSSLAVQPSCLNFSPRRHANPNERLNMPMDGAFKQVRRLSFENCPALSNQLLSQILVQTDGKLIHLTLSSCHFLEQAVDSICTYAPHLQTLRVIGKGEGQTSPTHVSLNLSELQTLHLHRVKINKLSLMTPDLTSWCVNDATIQNLIMSAPKLFAPPYVSIQGLAYVHIVDGHFFGRREVDYVMQDRPEDLQEKFMRRNHAAMASPSRSSGVPVHSLASSVRQGLTLFSPAADALQPETRGISPRRLSVCQQGDEL